MKEQNTEQGQSVGTCGAGCDCGANGDHDRICRKMEPKLRGGKMGMFTSKTDSPDYE